jgi:hypothetical protein
MKIVEISFCFDRAGKLDWTVEAKEGEPMIMGQPTMNLKVVRLTPHEAVVWAKALLHGASGAME